jgi:hypothetical protein
MIRVTNPPPEILTLHFPQVKMLAIQGKVVYVFMTRSMYFKLLITGMGILLF